ncbi:YfhO family protein [Enterococcus sp.]|uniref:YfhO family protein n=1 Tax=Enterococcus sp. TaxID=35783 RepID=UPI0028965B88|nr:YfhO family protein [Enterococcus sp.]
MQTIKAFVKEHRRYMLASFFLPFLIMTLIYLTIGIYPGSSRSVLASDAFSQFSNFHASFRNMLLGKQSIFYTWNASLGLNYLALISYYLGGIFTPLVLFFPNQLMPDALYFLTLIKIGSAGLAFWFYASQTFKVQRWQHVTLSVCYALMSFITAHSELIMWLDAMIYLPLVILGIDRLIQKRKPLLLFVSYLLLFLSSFYMGFMIGVFSVLYCLVQLGRNWTQAKGAVIPYSLTALLAGGASMIIVLPAIMDLHSNGEALTTVTKFKTEATDVLDIVMKNMVGVYDTTKYGSIPFIYIGLVPLLFCILYFVSRKVPLKDKLLYGCLFGILIASFYIVPLNLFWHGMHAPNMFLFRYAYLFSFLVIMLAGYGWEQLQQKDRGLFVIIGLSTIVVFALSYALKGADSYDYVTITSFALTIVFLILYLLCISFGQVGLLTQKRVSLLMLVFVCGEMAVNTSGMLRGILDDWNYASRSLYTEPYDDIRTLVTQANEANETFFRLENLDPVSSNDSINYGYSGVSMFSSIRNRNSSSYLDQLGFRSRGTNLNIRYLNNTLLMDAFTGIKYDISKQNLTKYGFERVGESGAYKLYENKNALPLAFLADPTIKDIEQPANDNLTSQTNLINGLANANYTYFSFQPITVIHTENTDISDDGMYTKLTEQTFNEAKEVTWQVEVPAHTQAYLSLYPANFGELDSSSATVTVNGIKRETQISINGQYYDLGTFDEATTVQFTASFYGTDEISFQNPQVVTLDNQAYQSAINAIQERGVEMTVGKRSAEAEITTDTEQQLVTTIPYDKGWSATLDGESVPITAFQDGFISMTIPSGTHQLKLTYLPQGFLPGVCLFFVCIALFILFLWLYPKYLSRRAQALEIDDSEK